MSGDASMGEAMEPAGQALGRFVANSQWADLDPALRHEARRSLLNFFGGALGVARDPAVTTPLGVMQFYTGVAQATVIGQSVRLDSMSAAFVNAIAANLLDYDDTHLNTVIHPTAPVAPPALAGRRGPARLHPGRGSRMPDRQRRIAGSLRTRLAHHLDLRRVRRRGRGGETTRVERDRYLARARHRGEPVRRAGGEFAERREERQRR